MELISTSNVPGVNRMRGSDLTTRMYLVLTERIELILHLNVPGVNITHRTDFTPATYLVKTKRMELISHLERTWCEQNARN